MARFVRWPYVTVAAGYAASIAAYSKLPHYSGHDDYHSPRFLIAFLLPTTAALIYVLVRRVWARDPIRDGDEAFEPTYDAILFPVVLFVMAIHLLLLGTLTGVLPMRGTMWVPRLTIVLFGMMVVRIGNLLPRTRPNLALGIRTPRTLADRRVWMQTHRMAGYVAVSLGGLLIVSGAFLSKQAIELVMGTAVPSAAMLLVVSHYRYSRSQKRA